MSLTASQIRFLVECGFTAENLAEFAELADKPADATAAERQRRYRARRDVSASDWEAIRRQVFERDGHACVYCGGDDRIACDHILPLSKGGLSTLDNLATACRPCNSSKGDRLVSEWRRGLN